MSSRRQSKEIGTLRSIAQLLGLYAPLAAPTQRPNVGLDEPFEPRRMRAVGRTSDG